MRALRNLFGDSRGAALVEFALVAPVLLLMVLGMFEMGYNFYIQSQLQGAIQTAARASTIEGATQTSSQIDARVTNAVHMLKPDATVTFSRRAYTDFSDVHQPEDYTDIDGDGMCDNGEPFEDANGNGVWDADRGVSGGGGARDAVLYIVTVTYPRAFGAANFVGLSPTFTTQASTVLRNQPYADQYVPAKVGNCP
ncbi:TadE/TadG family type IV pilus assembly protein [Tsuneonella mangrovi]|uniref:TadE/TadG family type IV pilus assembly protein n=1 Tax=Tsuneonella mangrovi TaxID=1982042 RepID=UPI000BA293BB|nr:TadE family protein [Tsuneonella mangrovi]